MPHLAPIPCIRPGCPHMKPCAMHSRKLFDSPKRKEYDDRRGSAASRGYGPQWRGVRLAFLAAHPICAICQHCVAVEVYHIEPHRGDVQKFWDFSNLQGLCKSCHSRKTARGG